MNLAEELEIRRINAALPFAAAIAPTVKFGGRDIVIAVMPWRAEERLTRQLKRFPAWGDFDG